MALFTIRQKQQMIVGAMPIVLGLALLSVIIKYWYVSVPIILVLAALVVWRIVVVRQRNKAPGPDSE